MHRTFAWIMVLLLLFGSFPYWADDAPEITDEMEKRFLKANDREKIEILYKISDFWIERSPWRCLDYRKEALAIARKINDKDEEVNALFNIGTVYERMGNNEMALEYYQQASKTFTVVQVEKREREKKSKRFNRIIALLSLALLLFFTFLLFRYYYRYRNFQQALHKSEERQKNLQIESRLKLFQSRVNPHFLFNSLDSIIAVQDKNNGRDLKGFITRLSNLYRSVFNSTEIQTAPLKSELDIIRDYLEIEKSISAGRLEYTISMAEDLLPFEIIPLLILPLVENAVIHGIQKQKEGGTISIDIQKKKTAINICIRDSGVGFEPEKMKPGFGLYSVQERLKLFYEGKARFDIVSSMGHGTTIMMEVPCARCHASQMQDAHC